MNDRQHNRPARLTFHSVLLFLHVPVLPFTMERTVEHSLHPPRPLVRISTHNDNVVANVLSLSSNIEKVNKLNVLGASTNHSPQRRSFLENGV